MSISICQPNYKKELENEILVDNYNYIVSSLFLINGANTIVGNIEKVTCDNAIRTLARKNPER